MHIFVLGRTYLISWSSTYFEVPFRTYKKYT
jgi:hypothetical protein